jgi:hypothetical protein
MRGASQNVDLDRRHFPALFGQIDRISCLTITGGEPTLPSGLKVINDMVDYLHMTDVKIDSFYMVTNAKTYREEIPRTLARLWHLCHSNDISALVISTDRYHESLNGHCAHFKHRIEESLLFDYSVGLHVHLKKDVPFENVIQQGRADNWACKELKPEELVWNYGWSEDMQEVSVHEGDVYLNCKGNIINGCDWSYKSQDDPKNIICHVSDSIADAIREKGKYDPER